MKIFINAGHGGSDPGACGNGLQEADITFNIARHVEGYLQAVGYDAKVFQLGGVDGDLESICAESNAWGADIFVSIHCNAGGGTGTETYHYEYSRAGKKLAACIQRQIVNSLPTVDRGLKTKIFGSDGYPYDVFVCKYTDCPAALVETAFIDNAYDANLLRERIDDFGRSEAYPKYRLWTVAETYLCHQHKITSCIKLSADEFYHRNFRRDNKNFL